MIKDKQGAYIRASNQTLNKESSTFFFFFLIFLATPGGMRDLSSLTRDGTHAPCSGSVESQPLDSQGSPLKDYLRQ